MADEVEKIVLPDSEVQSSSPAEAPSVDDANISMVESSAVIDDTIANGMGIEEKAEKQEQVDDKKEEVDEEEEEEEDEDISDLKVEVNIDWNEVNLSAIELPVGENFGINRYPQNPWRPRIPRERSCGVKSMPGCSLIRTAHECQCVLC